VAVGGGDVAVGGGGVGVGVATAIHVVLIADRLSSVIASEKNLTDNKPFNARQNTSKRGRHAYTWRSRGSSASRKPSPRRLKPRTRNMMETPGKKTIQGEVNMWLLLRLSIKPHSGVGG